MLQTEASLTAVTRGATAAAQCQRETSDEEDADHAEHGGDGNAPRAVEGGAHERAATRSNGRAGRRDACAPGAERRPSPGRSKRSATEADQPCPLVPVVEPAPVEPAEELGAGTAAVPLDGVCAAVEAAVGVAEVPVTVVPVDGAAEAAPAPEAVALGVDAAPVLALGVGAVAGVLAAGVAGAGVVAGVLAAGVAGAGVGAGVLTCEPEPDGAGAGELCLVPAEPLASVVPWLLVGVVDCLPVEADGEGAEEDCFRGARAAACGALAWVRVVDDGAECVEVERWLGAEYAGVDRSLEVARGL